MSDQRPRVRVLHADPDQPPVLVIDRWSGSPADLGSLDVRGQGFSGALVFQQAIDLDDDGLDEVGGQLVDGSRVTRAVDRLEAVVREAVREATGLELSTAVRKYADRLRGALHNLDAARATQQLAEIKSDG